MKLEEKLGAAALTLSPGEMAALVDRKQGGRSVIGSWRPEVGPNRTGPFLGSATISQVPIAVVGNS